uniref:Uncharacterized protein n=1 Tax=Jakoba bahamiensis TaxID=221721 RepID=M4QKW7_9EUKA|nr:hypothetical protein L038_mgp68 [Jakoba bahamiensis]AGH24103.1 hypothetical protein [Jakoba bahamiensis]
MIHPISLSDESFGASTHKIRTLCVESIFEYVVTKKAQELSH